MTRGPLAAHGYPRSIAAAPTADDDQHPARARWTFLAVAGLAVVAGLGIGRFVTAGDHAAGTAAEVPAFSSTDPPEQQIAALKATVTTDPGDATAWRLLGTAYAALGAQTQDPDLVASAQEAFERATALSPGDPTILVGRGALALTNHRFAEAERLGLEATRRLPANADALGILVDAQVELGRYEDAADTLAAMLDARPGLPALARTSYLRELHGDLPGAKEAMRRAAIAGAASPYDVATVTALLGDLERKSGDLEAAATRYERALDAAPGLTTAQVGSAWTRAASGDVTGAIEDLEERVAGLPTPSLLLLLHDLQVASGDPDASDTAELVRAVAALQEESGQVVDLEMAIFEADVASDPERAVALAEQAQEARPDNVFVDDAMAWTLFRAGHTQAAVPFIEQALRLGTTEPLLRYHAAEILAAAGRSTEAADHLVIALRDPWFSFQHREDAMELAAALDVPVAAGA